MSNTLYLGSNIKKKLENGPLSMKEIKSRILHDPDMDTPRRKGSWNEAFNRLLLNGDIKSDGYTVDDGSQIVDDNHRYQSMNIEQMIFTLVKTEKFDIDHSIKLLNSNDKEEAKKNYYKLESLFKNKVNKIESQNSTRWESFERKIIIRNPRAEDLLRLEGEDEETALLYANSYLIDAMYPLDADELNNNANRYDMNTLKAKYSEYKVFILKDPKNKRELPLSIERILSSPATENEFYEPKSLEESFVGYDDLHYNRKISKYLNKERYIEEMGFKRPKKMNSQKILDLFEDLIDYINSNNLYPELARGLRGRQGLNEILNELVYNATNKETSLIKKFQ